MKKKLPATAYKTVKKINLVTTERKKNKQEVKSAYPDVSNVTQYTSDMLKNNNDIITLFPDIQLAIDIGATSVISPSDGLKTALTHSNKVTYITPTTMNNITTTIASHMEETFELEKDLTNILVEALYTKGSYINILVPGTLTEKLTDINTKPALEEFIAKEVEASEVLNFTDDIALLYANDSVEKLTVSGTEDIDYSTEISKMFRLLDKSHNVQNVNFDDYDINDHITSPARIKIPVESFVPVTLQNDNTRVIGGFILIDENGSPTNKIVPPESEEQTSDLTLEGSMLTTIRKQISKKTATAPSAPITKNDIDGFVDKNIYDLIKNDSKLSTTINKDELDIIKHTMFSRLLANQKTSVIYVSHKYLETYTFNYRSNGTGESLLERIRVLASIRAIIFFTRLKAEIANNVPTTKITLDIDDEHIDPESVRDAAIAEFIKNKQFDIPVGLQTINDLSDWIHKLGYFFEVNNKNIPSLKMDISDVTRSVNIPDETIEKEISDKILMSLGTTPETVDNSKEPDFATTEILKNIVVARKAKNTQHAYNAMLTNNCRKIMRLDGELTRKLTNVLLPEVSKLKTVLSSIFKIDKSKMKTEDILDYVIKDIINKHHLTLPEIKIEDDDKLETAFEDYETKIDTALEYYIYSDFVTSENAGTLSDNIDEYKAAAKATLMRRWMAKNNYLPELSEIITITDSEHLRIGVIDEHVEYIERLIIALESPLKKDEKVKKKIEKTYEKLGDDGDDENLDEDPTDEQKDTDTEQDEDKDKTQTEDDMEI